jgi:hydrogenase maturation protein HypF
MGGYHILADARRDDVVAELRRRKKRPSQPFAVMALDLDVAKALVELDEKAAKLLTSPQRPIVLLPKREDSPVSPLVSPGLDKEGVFLLYNTFSCRILGVNSP